MNTSLENLVNGAKNGNLISFPTDTVPALASLPEKAELIFNAKQRSLDKPLILMGAKADDLWDYVLGDHLELEIWQNVVNQYWPGALTLVLPASKKVPPVMNPHDKNTIGLRVPNQAIAQNILAQTGPLATTSVNLSGQPALENLSEIEKYFPEVMTLTSVDYKGLGIPSTVVKWTKNGWEILRQGVIKIDN